MELPPDEITRSAMVALIARWNLAYYENKAQETIRDAAAKKIEQNEQIIADCRAACRSFGYDRENDGAWKTAMELFADDAVALYNRTKPESFPTLGQKRDTEAVEAASSKAPEETVRPPIRQIALDRLAVAAETGLKAAEIREFIEKTYPKSGDIHEKTVGMTLYRLLKDDLVRRQGHTWFFVPQGETTKNPAGETAGVATSQ